MTVDDIMALAGVLATKRVLRYRASVTAAGRSAGATELERAEQAVERAAAELRAAVEKLCAAPSTTTATAST